MLEYIKSILDFFLVKIEDQVTQLFNICLEVALFGFQMCNLLHGEHCIYH